MHSFETKKSHNEGKTPTIPLLVDVTPQGFAVTTGALSQFHDYCGTEYLKPAVYRTDTEIQIFLAVNYSPIDKKIIDQCQSGVEGTRETMNEADQHGYVITSIIKCGIKLLMHS